MPSPAKKHPMTVLSILAAVALTASIVASAPATAQLAPPWDGNPISHGLGPTYGETWCADPAPGSNIANQQGAPLALIPQEAIACTLDRFNQEAADAGVPPRMTYSVIGSSDAGRDLYGVVVNALETPEQQRDYDRWLQIRDLMFRDPAGAQALLESFGEDVKLPVFIEANIHGNEEESTDAMMQVVRDLVTLPYGINAEVDNFLDHAILILIPSQNPDGRFIGQRTNANGFDMNRDLLVQSQPEIRANVALQQQWLAPVGLAMHGYVNPTLIDGLTKPHNPGIDYDLFLKWNQRRLDVNEEALADVGMGITRPVNQWNADAEDTPPPVGPPYAEGWDDWGPFYTQTYMAFYGVDSSTLEMCSGGAGCNGRFGSKRAQYIGFYSSVGYWIANRNAILHDQLEIFRRGIDGAPRPPCCDDPLISGRGFAADQHDWMVPYPKAFVIPFGGGPAGQPLAFDDGQRSDAEANRLVQWLLDNGIEVGRTNKDFTWNGQTFAKKSYVVDMEQPLRGLAYTTLAAGQDVSARITQLYAPPGAWSHGLLWGADTVEIPASDTAFNPQVNPIAAPNPLAGGVHGGGKADWYALTIRGASEVRAVLDLLRAGVDGEIAETSFPSASAGAMPAGSLIFPNDSATVTALTNAGLGAGVYFERGVGAKPATTALAEAPRVAVLVNSANPAINDTLWGLQRIFGLDAQFVSTIGGANSLQNAGSDPLATYDVIYNAGQNFPGSINIASAATPGASEAGTTVTIQTTNTHNLAAGSTVTIAGVPVAGYNGTFTVTGTPANNRFTYEAAASGLAPSGGGTVTYTSARDRLNAFFTGGGGYIGTSQSASNFAFMVGAGLVNAIAQGSASAGGGIARWDNDAGASSPVTGGYPPYDFLYLPSNITYFSTTPAAAVVDGTYQTPDTSLFVAGLWRNRTSPASVAALNAPVVLHGESLLGSRYLAYATNPFSRGDAEREWALIGQAALWTDLTDEE